MTSRAPERLTSTQLSLVIGGLFPNLLFFVFAEHGWTAGRNPYTLPVVGAVASLVIAAPFYLSLQSVATEPRSGSANAWNKVEELVCAVYLVGLSAFVAQAAGGHIFNCWRSFLDIQHTWPSAASTRIASVWLIWSVLAVSGGYAGLAASSRFWIPASLAMVVGNGVADWREVAQLFASPGPSETWSGIVGALPEPIVYCLPLTLAVAVVAGDAGPEWRSKTVVWRGVVAPVFFTLILVWELFAVSVGPTADGRPFWHYAGRFTYPLNSAKGLLFTLTLLPLARFCAAILIGLLAPLGRASSWCAAAILLGSLLWESQEGRATWGTPWLAWSGLAACVLSGARSATLPVRSLLKTKVTSASKRSGVVCGCLTVFAIFFVGLFLPHVPSVPCDLGQWPGGCTTIYVSSFGAAFAGTLVAAILARASRSRLTATSPQ